MALLSQQRTLSTVLSLAAQMLIFIFLSSIESIFFSPRNSFIEVDLWIVSLIFICLHRTLSVSFIFCFLSSLFFAAFSGIPTHAALLSFLSVFTILHIIKNRSFTAGASYFSICAFVSIVTFYFSYFVISWVLGEHPITNPSVIKWLTSAFMSSALFVIIRPLLIYMDSFFEVQYPFGFEV